MKNIFIKKSQDAFGLPEIPKTSPGASSDFGMPNVKQKPISSNLISGSNAIKNMQNAIINFAKTLSSSYFGSKDQIGQQETESGSYLGGENPFGNFIVNQYINKSNKDKKQYVNVDLQQPNRSQTGIQDTNFKGIVSTIMRIGTPGAENKPDGVWKGRTDNALKQIYSLASALLNLQKDMNVKTKGYSDEFLNQLKEISQKSYTEMSSQEMNSYAIALTKNINTLTNFYKNFQKSILDNPKYKTIITQEEPLIKYNEPSEMLSKEEKDFFDKNIKASIPNVNINGKPVTLADISTANNFKQFLANNNIKADAVSYKKYLDLIKSMLGQQEKTDQEISESAGY